MRGLAAIPGGVVVTAARGAGGMKAAPKEADIGRSERGRDHRA